MPPTSGDLRWLAGLLEGEGHFGFHNRKAQVSLQMTDRDVVERAAKIIGQRVNGPYYDTRAPRRKPYWATSCVAGKAAGLMMTLYRDLGERRRESIRAALRAWREVPARPHTRDRDRTGSGRQRTRHAA